MGYNRRDMATNFPTSLDNLTNPAGSDPVNNPSHASQHANLNDAIEKLEEKVGVNNSAVTTSLDYRVKQLETNPVASYTDEEARNAIGTALTGSGGITVTPNNVANTITVSTDSTIATKTYVDTAVSNLGSTAASTYVPVSEVGQADGIATLDATGQVPFSQLGNLVASAPATLDTLNELATALGNDANFATTTATSIGNKVSKAGGDIIEPSSASVTGLTIKGAVSQTANLQQWLNSSGDLLGRFHPTAGLLIPGVANTGGGAAPFMVFDSTNFSLYTNTASNKGLVIRGAASQTASLMEFQNSAGNVLSFIGTIGQFGTSATVRGSTGGIFGGIGQLSSAGLTVYATAAGNPGAIVRGAASQTANLMEFQNSAGTVISRVRPDGQIGVGSTLITGTNFFVNNTISTTNVVATIRGAVAQTANLQEWQNSTGTILSKVDASGAMFTITPTAGANTTQVATTEFVQSEIDANVQPGALYQTSAPSSPAVGQIWIDSDEDVTTFDPNIIRRKAITATAGQTVFTADLPFIDGFEQIFMNGLLLVKTTDYATSGGNTVTLTSAAAASDIIEIVSVTGANSVNTYTQAEVNALLAANTSVAPLSISANTTLVAKKRYFVTSASALTLTLPSSPALNDEIQIVDASGNASTYNITVARNANKINGGLNNLIIDTNGGWYTLLYTGATYGWKVG